MPAVKTVKVAADVRDVLSRSAITFGGPTRKGTCYLLALPEQLERDLYQRVDKVLKVAGGRWNRSMQRHVFADDPRAVFELAQKGAVVDTRKTWAQFFTPPALAREVAEAARSWLFMPVGAEKRGVRVLEPSAGKGALIQAVDDLLGGASWNLTAVEIDPKLAAELRVRWDGARIHNEDFLEYVSIIKAWPPFDVVLMNPPFLGIEALKHVVAAWNLLLPGGVLVAVLPSGAWDPDSSASVRRVFATLVREHGEVLSTHDDTFEGTAVKVDVVRFVKPRGTP